MAGQEVDTYRVSREPDPKLGGKYWLWQVEIDGGWIFRNALAQEELLDFVTTHRFVGQDDQYQYWRDPASDVARYNREMDARNRIVAENRDKPWLPIQPGE